MKKIIAVNCSPRNGWNTDILVRQAASGARFCGADVEVIDLYKLDKFTGCVSCFSCKLDGHLGECVCRDGLYDVLQKIRRADGLILGTPNYLGGASAGFRALYERLIFQYITYKNEPRSYGVKKIPILLIFTSNASEDSYLSGSYKNLVDNYIGTLNNFIGPTELLISGNTLQVNDYERYNWDRFNPEEKMLRREKIFPRHKEEAFNLGARLVK